MDCINLGTEFPTLTEAERPEHEVDEPQREERDEGQPDGVDVDGPVEGHLVLHKHVAAAGAALAAFQHQETLERDGIVFAQWEHNQFANVTCRYTVLHVIYKIS